MEKPYRAGRASLLLQFNARTLSRLLLLSGSLSLSPAYAGELVSPDGSQDQLDELTDTQLTDLAADWSRLDGNQRSELIQETQARMQPQEPTTPKAVSGVAASPAPADATPLSNDRAAGPTSARGQQTMQRRRYGRLIRKSDGTVMRSVVQVQIQTRSTQGEESDRRRAYGMGFELRHYALPTDRVQTDRGQTNRVSTERTQPAHAQRYPLVKTPLVTPVSGPHAAQNP